MYQSEVKFNSFRAGNCRCDIKFKMNKDLMKKSCSLKINSIITNNKYHFEIKFDSLVVNPFKPEFTVVIFIHYKPRIAVTILDL